MSQTVENLPAMKEIQIRSLGQEDPLERGMATHSNILAWDIPGTEEPGGLQSMGSQKVRHNWGTKQHRDETDSLYVTAATVPHQATLSRV